MLGFTNFVTADTSGGIIQDVKEGFIKSIITLFWNRNDSVKVRVNLLPQLGLELGRTCRDHNYK